MPRTDKQAAIELLAKMAASLARRDPDEHVEVKLGDVVAFEGVAWRYHDFIVRAEAAYEALIGPVQAAGQSERVALACYRYRTPVLAGPWRRRPDTAISDAVKAGQVNLREDGELSWSVSGNIERSECRSDAACKGVYPPN